MSWFDGQTALVTGAAQGIGLSTAELLATLGARVIAVDADLDALEANLPGAQYVRCRGDLAGAATGDLADEIWQRHGPFELLVNNVGVATEHGFLDLDRADFDRVFDTNLRGPWFFTKRVAQRLVDTRAGGAIVFVSSLHQSFVSARPHYSASKAGVAMLSKELAAELAPHGIRVNAVSPGAIRSASNPHDTPGHKVWAERTVPMSRPGEPVEVARMVAVLLSDDWSGYVTGANVRVDGGLALHTWTHTDRPDDASAPEPPGLLARMRRNSRGSGGR